MRGRALVMAGVLLAACGPRASSDGLAGDGPAPIPGCYTAELGAWTPDFEPSRHQLPPAVFELREEIGEGMFERGKTVVRPVAGDVDDRSAYWTRPAPDSLILTWTTGYEGLRLRLARDESGPGWTGLATAFTDVIIHGRPTPSAPVRASRVACF